MNVQLIDLENFEARLADKFERYQLRYKITHADLAWILLRIGTSYYFKDICSRGLDGNAVLPGNGGYK
ncbi:MAG: hypothetical protein A2Z29_02885 [Chloroflexi bacterium RBG_16_56_11]|nr:MAG: hypothetical protein A2Z29_02885 [Chloroflexi bacterium RBG_16_56_11]